jgi:hypothetical protein
VSAPERGGVTPAWCSPSCRRRWLAERRRYEREVDYWAEAVADAESELATRPRWAKPAVRFRRAQLRAAEKALDGFLRAAGVVMRP